MSAVIIRSATPLGKIRAIASKSAAHRLLICSAFADKESIIRCETLNNDILATASCLEVMGAGIKYEKPNFIVTPIKDLKSGGTVDCGESGSTLRFLLPVVCALGGKWSLKMSGRLPERPLSPLKEELEAHGIAFSYPQRDVISCEGKLSAGSYSISGEVSSQFVSGLLFALSILDGKSTLTVTGNIESAPYIDMTLDALLSFEADIKQNANVFTVNGTSLKARERCEVEGDWSGAAFAICAGALSENGVTIDGLNFSSRQGDMRILSIVEQFGADVKINENSVTVKRSELFGIDVDARQIPDLVPVIATVASVAKGTTNIYGAARLRIKESDRLQTTADMLNALGADVKQTDDGLMIVGKPSLVGGTVDSFNDHRIAMSAAVAASVCKGAVTVTDADAVSKSYPDFWRDFERIGYDVEYLN